jgi:hypothetical protein
MLFYALVRSRPALLLAAASIVIAGCGSAGITSNLPTPIVITVTPNINSIAVNATQQFSATVTGATTATVWGFFFSSLGQGPITQTGLYTAPSTPPIYTASDLSLGAVNGQVRLLIAASAGALSGTAPPQIFTVTGPIMDEDHPASRGRNSLHSLSLLRQPFWGVAQV